jgi:phosphoglycolate phosphatase
VKTVNVLFDLDGTLTDPGDGFVNCVSHALSKLDCLAHTPSEIRRHVGPPLEETLRTLLGGDITKLSAAVALYRERYGTHGYLENAVYPEVHEMLEGLKSKGMVLFVATSKPTAFARRILEHFGLARYFEDIYGSEFDGTNANKTHLIAHILKRESLLPASTAMIGDRAHDIVAALANGVGAIGVLWGYGSREELANAGAMALYERPSGLARGIISP